MGGGVRGTVYGSSGIGTRWVTRSWQKTVTSRILRIVSQIRATSPQNLRMLCHLLCRHASGLIRPLAAITAARLLEIDEISLQ